jgi:hypothetical protein
MIFRFWSEETGGDEILIDEHPSGSEKEVIVSGGLFSVALGSGDIFDGSGPGTYASLAEVFRDYATVWLEVEVHPEVLSPRIRIISAAYAMNADHLDGKHANEFLNTSATTQQKDGTIRVVADQDYGIHATANTAGGYFADQTSSGYAYAGYGDYGIEAAGHSAGGYFEDGDSTGHAYLGHGDYGITAYGDLAGGHFESYASTVHASLATLIYGISAQGTAAGGEFLFAGSNSKAYLATMTSGITSIGSQTGGFFTNSSDTGDVYIVDSGFGVDASGTLAGGHFVDKDASGIARLGYGDLGIWARGDTSGGHFETDNGSGYAYAGYGDFGVRGFGDEAGGYFGDTNGSSMVWVGRNDNGISSYGNDMGGYFEDANNGTYSRIAYGDSSISSNGTKHFVQNHPYEQDKVIVYSSLEGDEVGTYTRGTARLQDGVARVPLGETFRWVTNPGIGLTAHLTPRGAATPLAVVSLTPEELVVAGPIDGLQEIAFDYLVLGLRIGFEEMSPVREKDGEAFIPSMSAQRRRYEKSPDLRRFNSLERFKKMTAAARGTDDYEPDLTAAQALRAAIQEYDPAVHGPLSERLVKGGDRLEKVPRPEKLRTVDTVQVEADPSIDTFDGVASEDPAVEPAHDLVAGVSLLPVSEPVERGDLLALDPEHPGHLRRAAAAADPAVIGIVAAEAFDDDDALQAPVVGTGFAVVNVDAGYGAVRAGDLLTSSPTPGHAMVVLDPVPGTVIGKALESLDHGTGTIGILVNIR